MQNRYAGDIGDYSKFVLLRKLFDESRYRIGLIWYLYPDESHNDDGRYIDYVQKKEYQDCDPSLVKGLSRIIAGSRSVKALQAMNALPRNTLYYSAPLNFHLIYNKQTRAHKHQRTKLRREWLEHACTIMSDCNVVVLDPDNGMQIKSCPGMHQIKSGKFAYYSEIRQFFHNKAVCIIYQHLNRTQSHKTQIHQRAQELKKIISQDSAVFCIRFSPYSPRAYFILSARDETKNIRNKVQAMLNGICATGWDSFYEC